GKAVQLVYAPYSASQQMYQPGDTIESQIGGGLMAQLSGELMPKIESISTQADSLLRAVRVLVESKELNNSLVSIEKTTSELALTSTQLKSLMNNDFPKILGDVNLLTSDFRQISGNLKKIDFAATFASINHTINNLSLITDKINTSEGTIGSLLNDKSLYINLANTASSADNLLIDLKKNPARYVSFSLIGRKTK
ncbi:MAG TPA: MCE family protein, partial [Paludibacter sp.]|nr:MCE family protein [Paludibacter sp.]